MASIKTQQLQIKPITQQLTLGELIKRYPMSLNVFLQYGMPCRGCSVPTWMTVQEAGKQLGMDKSKIDKMITEANKTIVKASKNFKKGELIHFTDNAIKKVKELLEKEKKQNHVLRIDIIEGGCSGYRYAFSIDKKSGKNDEVIEKKGFSIVISKEALPLLQTSTVDYIESLQGSGFKIDNPNARNTCACGDSFH